MAANQGKLRHEAPAPRKPEPTAPQRHASESQHAPADHRRVGRVISIRFIVTATTVALVAGVVLGVGFVGEQHTRSMLSSEIEARVLMTARNLARVGSSALLSEFPELTLHPVIRELHNDHPELAYAVVVDHESRIQGHWNARELGERFKPPLQIREVATSYSLTRGEKILENREALSARVPVRHPGGADIGTVYVGLQRDYFEAALTESRQRQAFTLLVLLVLAVVCALVLTSALLKPIDEVRSGLQRIGSGDLGTPIELRDRTEFQLLAESVNDMARQLQAAQSDLVDKERLKHEMELAREIQGSLLPASSFVVDDFEIIGVHQAAAEVGGDYFDVLQLPDGRIGIAIADVSGKGLAGCLVMSMVAVLLRSLRSSYTAPRELLIALDEQLSCNLRPGVFVTMFYGILDPKEGRLTYASAGHNPLLVQRVASGSTEWHYTDAIPVGAVRGGALASTLKDAELELQPGDTLVQFTDGVNEAWEPSEMQQFGFERVEEVVRDNAPGGACAVLDGIRRALVKWTGELPRMDDENVVVLHRRGMKWQTREAIDPGISTPHELAEHVWELRDWGYHLSFRARLSEFERLADWIAQGPHLVGLPEAERALLEHALHELCDNIAQHGLADDAAEALDLWWIPEADVWHGERTRDPHLLKDDPELSEQLQRGVFLVRDCGVPFPPTGPPDTDLDNPNVRKRGRGLGLRIIQDVMNPLLYLEETEHGNLTLMRFDPVEQWRRKEVEHVSFTP
jgi:sigma-B regulation protein RsbU (phosphoserine phosphatase)